MSDQLSTRAENAPEITSFADLQELAKLFDGDGRMRLTAEQQDVQHDNTRQAGIAAFTLAQFAIRSNRWHPNRRATGGDNVELSGVVRDLLTAIRHLADAAAMDFDQIAHDSYGTYRSDTLVQD